MKNIKVVAAIILREKNGRKEILATERGYGDLKGGWEFPGGKLEKGENAEEALIREIKEELDTEIEIKEFFENIDYTYPTFHLDMDCFITELKSDFTLSVHDNYRWLDSDNLRTVDWLPADITLIDKLEKYIS